ncbi:Hypothetical predicted protein [Marmota monax]|uniref:Uncharacterized protein n=1 Tax=Marmota monax TaxID=9995 RepID=A0A5E4CR03_MARMO|nr:Hypothetical predicted protein [Marmota monax]
MKVTLGRGVGSRQGSGRGGSGWGQPGRPREDAGSRSGARGGAGRGAGRVTRAAGVDAPLAHEAAPGGEGALRPVPRRRLARATCGFVLPRADPSPETQIVYPRGSAGWRVRVRPPEPHPCPPVTVDTAREAPVCPKPCSGTGSAVGVTHPSPIFSQPTEGPRGVSFQSLVEKGQTPGDLWEPIRDASGQSLPIQQPWPGWWGENSENVRSLSIREKEL